MGPRVPRSGLVRSLSLLLAALAALLLPSPVGAQESVLQEEAPPSSVEKSAVSTDRSFEEPPEAVTIREFLKRWLKEQTPFLRDTKLSLKLRTYYLYKDRFDDAFNEAWAAGGWLSYKSGYLADHFAVGATVFTSLPVYAPDDRDGTLLLRTGQNEYTVLGEAYAEIRIVEQIVVDLYRQAYNTPFINRNDNRMTPNTFEGYSIKGVHGGKEGAPRITWGAGYVTKIKERDSSDFVWMSHDAGVTGEDRGVFAAGAKYETKAMTLGLFEYYCQDVINIIYAEGKYVWTLENGVGLLVAGQFGHEMSTGDDLLTGSSFSTNQFGLKGEASFGGVVVTLGYTMTANGSDMRNPWSSYPGYTSVQVQDFNRQGEQAVLGRVSYDFSKIGVAGLTFYALWVHGWDRDTGPDEDELNLDLQWRPKPKNAEGFLVRIRYARVEQRGASDDTLEDFRIIVECDF